MRARAIVGVALVLALVACQSGEGDVIYDLGRSAPVAEIGNDQRLLDLGAPDSRSSLVSGWSWNERSGDDVTFVWSDGRESVLEVEVYRLPVAVLELTAIPWEHEAGSVQEVAVRWNGQALGSVEMTAAGGFASYRVPVPSSLVVPGVHRIAFQYGSTMSDHRPDDVSPGRDLAVAWDSVALLPMAADREEVPPGEAGPAVGGGPRGDDLVLPVGVRLGYVLDLPAGARGASELVIDRVAGEPGSSAELVILVGGRGESMRVVERVAVGSGTRLALEAGPGGWSDLWLAAAGDSTPEHAARTLRLVRPRIVAAPAP